MRISFKRNGFIALASMLSFAVYAGDNLPLATAASGTNGSIQVSEHGVDTSNEIQQARVIQGTVLEEGTNEPLIGVNVVVKGCLSDGILGMWMASVCGLDEVLDNEKVRSHLVAVHKYNLKHDLVDHFNPQRPVYACGKDGGLLLCTWPKGGMLSLPFVYSNEVWTGIEYQVASHLMMKGEVEKGLDIVRECRERYDGRVRNPFNEIECGHWYARAMASYGMLQGLTGVRYDAVDKTMYIDSKIGDFKSFISTDTGFGTIEWKAGKPVLNVVYGNIEVKCYNVSGKIVD